MKKIIILLLLSCAYSFINAQSYDPIVDTNKVWSNIYWSYPFYKSTHFIKFSGDTVINSKYCKKIFQSDEEEQTNWYHYEIGVYKYIREDSIKKVYLVSADGNEYLIYDFSVNNINDTAMFSGLTPLLVGLIDTVLISNILRKRIYLYREGDIFEPEYCEIWIEGIGSSCGILYSGEFGIVGTGHEFLCLTENDTLIYQNPEYSSCYIMTEIEDAGNCIVDIQIYPNPLKTYLSVIINNDAEDNYYLSLYDLTGKHLMSHRIKKSTEIDISKLNPGIYLYRITSTNDIIKTGKIIIQ